jgi:WhiB family redox-sensing transcriptional regulator
MPAPRPLAVPMPDMSVAACRAADPDIFFDENVERRDMASPEVLAYCNRCVIKDECLKWATATKQPHGMWGGTTPRQRTKLATKTARTACPGCASQDIFEMVNEEICISCGLSWRI